MKKLAICALLTIAVGVICLTSGCARKYGPNTVVLTTDDLIYTRDAYKNAIKRFEDKHPGWKVRHIEIGGDPYQKLLTMFAGNSDPDVLWLGQGLGVFAGKGLLADLQPLIDNDPVAKKLVSQLHPKVVAAYRRGKALYGLPFGVNTQFLAYNKDVFDRGGVAYPNDKWTRKDVYEAARKLTFRDPKNPKKVLVYGLLNAPHPFAFGVDFLSQDGKRVVIDTESRTQTASYLQFLWDITNGRDKYGNDIKVSPNQDLEKTMGMNVLIAFSTGRAAMTALEDYSIQDVRTYSEAGANWDLALVPPMSDKERRTWASTSGYCISNRSKHKKMAFEMLKELASPEFQREIYPQALPANMNTMKEVVLADKQLPPNAAKTMIESMKYIRVAPRIAKFFEADNIWNDNAGKFWVMDPDSTQEELTAKINEVLEKTQKDLQPVVDK